MKSNSNHANDWHDITSFVNAFVHHVLYCSELWCSWFIVSAAYWVGIIHTDTLYNVHNSHWSGHLISYRMIGLQYSSYSTGNGGGYTGTWWIRSTQDSKHHGVYTQSHWYLNYEDEKSPCVCGKPHWLGTSASLLKLPRATARALAFNDPPKIDRRRQPYRSTVFSFMLSWLKPYSLDKLYAKTKLLTLLSDGVSAELHRRVSSFPGKHLYSLWLLRLPIFLSSG